MHTSDLYSIYKKNPKICTDSRKIIKGSIFFALKGNNFNGNMFAEKAIKKGCVKAIIDEKKYHNPTSTILVDDVLEALQDLARYHRNRLSIPIIGITGTNGKTTSKELISNILKKKYNTYSTKGNLNNHIGVPLSILDIDSNIEIGVIEMGANHEKEIEFLCNIAQPEYGIITNIGSAHLEGFKNIEGVKNTKNELYKYIQDNNGLVFVNNKDLLLINLSKNIKKIEYGQNANINSNSLFTNITYKGKSIKSKLIGEYQLDNIMLSISVGEYFNISFENIKSSIEEYIPSDNRSEIIRTNKNLVILDAYNANPSSMKAMLKSFSKYKSNNKLCILGDMLELGECSMQEHIDIIKLCADLKLETLFVGTEFKTIKKESFRTKEDINKYIQKNKTTNKTILLKGSRGIQLETLISLL